MSKLAMNKSPYESIRDGLPKPRHIDVVLSQGRYRPGEEVRVVVALGRGFEDSRVDWLLAQAYGEVTGLHGADLNREKLSFRAPQEVSRPSITSTHGFVSAEQRLSSSSALLFSTPPEILAVSIDPKDSRQAVYQFTLPHLLPPSFNGKYTSIRYYVTVAAGADSTVFESKTPLRVTAEEDGDLNCVGRAVRCVTRPDAIFNNYDTMEDRRLTWAARKAMTRVRTTEAPAFGKKNFSISFNKSPVGEISVSGRWNPHERLLNVNLDAPMTISVRFSSARGSTPTEHLRVRLVRTERPRDELAGVHRTAVAECILPSVHECGLVSSAVPLYVPLEEPPSFSLPGAVRVSHQIVFDFFVLDDDNLTRVTWTLNSRVLDGGAAAGGEEEGEVETPITTPLPFRPEEDEEDKAGSLLIREARGVRKGAADTKADIDCILRFFDTTPSTTPTVVMSGLFSLHPHPIGIKWWTSLWRNNKNLSGAELNAKMASATQQFTHRHLGRYFYAHRAGSWGTQAPFVVAFIGIKLAAMMYGTRRDQKAAIAAAEAYGQGGFM
ncbi:hypothetical protein FOZ62_000104, partial [Perkinsus olseni]